MSKERCYVDSNVFISLLHKIPERFDACLHLWNRALRDELVIVTSAMTIAEVVHLPPGSETEELKRKRIIDLFEYDFIVVRAIDRSVAIAASELGRSFGLKPADAIHVATAVDVKADVLYTYDGSAGGRKKMISFSGKIGTPPLLIMTPPKPPPPEMKLFD